MSESKKFRLKRDEPLDDDLRRVARGRIDHAVAALRDPDADPTEAVHTARKDVKKLRSTLRLVRPVIGEKLYAAENARFRDASRGLSDARDAQVRSATVDALGECFAGDEPPGGWWAVRAALAAPDADSPPGLDEDRERAAAAIEAGRDEVDRWPLTGSGFKLVAPGVRGAYSRGRKRYRQALDDPTDERLHELRKRAKDLWYHVRLARSGWPAMLEATANQAHELSDLLGDDHDLVLLTEYLDRGEAPLSAEQLDHLRKLIEKRRSELQTQSFALAARLLAERPKRYAARLRAYWKAPPLE